jgi:hypothetical protein
MTVTTPTNPDRIPSPATDSAVDPATHPATDARWAPPPSAR